MTCADDRHRPPCNSFTPRRSYAASLPSGSGAGALPAAVRHRGVRETGGENLAGGRSCRGAVCGCPRRVARRVLYLACEPGVGARDIWHKGETAMTTPQGTEQYIHRAAVDAEGNR